MSAVTNRVPGNGTNTLSYVIPGAGLDVEAVRVVVDASGAGGPVTAEVKITDQSGVVIATKPQPQTIDAGGTGSATWALRLDDDLASSSGGGGIDFDTYPQAGMDLYAETVGGDLSGFPPWYPDVHARYPGIPNGMYTSEGAFFVVADATSFMVYCESGEIDLYADPANSGVTRLTQHQLFVESHFVQIDATQDITIETTSISGSTPTIEIASQFDLLLQTGNERLVIVGLPTSNPGGSGRVWNNGGVLNIT